MNSKLIGGILLVVGTTIGAGMLALPVATAQLGFWGSTLLLIACWGVMTTCAFLFLEANLWLPASSNYVSMAGVTLGKAGQVVAWVVYLVLLYSILAAYISGGGDLFHYLLSTGGITLPLSVASVLFTILFGVVVYFGIKLVDYVNRGLMFGKMGALVFLILLILPFVSSGHLGEGEFKYFFAPTSISVTVVAFTCLMIIPSLRAYFGEDVKSLKIAIVLGTLIPLVCYILWDMVIMGVIPLEGSPSLLALMHSSNSNSGLVAALTTLLNKDNITFLAKFFTSICMATSFLSVSLSLSDFLSDGLRVAKQGMIGNSLVLGATFLPPLFVVLFYPDAFLTALQYAGICCFVLMVLFPPLMVWRGRYHYELGQDSRQVRGGKALLLLLLGFGVILIGTGIEGVI